MCRKLELIQRGKKKLVCNYDECPRPVRVTLNEGTGWSDAVIIIGQLEFRFAEILSGVSSKKNKNKKITL